jgi:hypothetical protein
MDSYVNSAPGFDACMAKRVWEDFTGSSWKLLTSIEREPFITAAATGPKNTIRSILTSNLFQSLRSPQLKEIKTTVDVVYEFNADVMPILEKSCSGSSCHNSDSGLGSNYQYLADEAKFKGAPAGRVGDGSMPPANSGKSLSKSDAELLLLYLDQDN